MKLNDRGLDHARTVNLERKNVLRIVEAYLVTAGFKEEKNPKTGKVRTVGPWEDPNAAGTEVPAPDQSLVAVEP
jgi:hypothetical protein